MCNTDANINARDVIVNRKKIKKVNDYVYLDQRVGKNYDQEQDCTWLDSIQQAEQHLTKQKSSDVA